ncbi:MAG: hypothetical protein A3C44_00765 [Gammaproteobacteria bacterium RIFCSPHIGHO2_02_FULL_39_13]|nr:MAG: hypothetical protein A3C44_00765 [Gammaproteobacteria bacterium RIFCSPHIGHO2_02_FULL_39_13]OGT49900.1 MAG: hypothetical protein A3E53_02970 [Gammaproteobacteria bacterium RIFCSPHIGHO2_12_FULL_39_24]
MAIASYPKEILVGRNTDAKYIAFGDDSSCGNILLYAFLIIERTNTQSIEGKVVTLKERYKIPDSTPLHCKELLSGQYRKKHKIDHLAPDDIRKIFTGVFDILNEASACVRYSHCDLQSGLDNLGVNDKKNTIEFQHVSGKTIDFPLSKVTEDFKKLFLNILPSLCWQIPSAEFPSVENCYIVASADTTIIKPFGKPGQRADNLNFGYSDINLPANTLSRLSPEIAKTNDHIMLQLADIVAYIFSHSHGENPNIEFYKKLMLHLRSVGHPMTLTHAAPPVMAINQGRR